MFEFIGFCLDTLEFIVYTIAYWRVSISIAAAALLAAGVCANLAEPRLSLIVGAVILLAGIIFGIIWQRQPRGK